jgi:hypothetical protein
MLHAERFKLSIVEHRTNEPNHQLDKLVVVHHCHVLIEGSFDVCGVVGGQWSMYIFFIFLLP